MGYGLEARLVLTLGLLLLVLPRSALAFCRTTTCDIANPPPECVADAVSGCFLQGIPVAWRRACVSFAVNDQGSPLLELEAREAAELASRAFARWSLAACDSGVPSIQAWDLGPMLCSRVEYFPNGPNANLIVFREQSWEHGFLTAALTTVTFLEGTGEIVDADLEVNVVDFAPSREFLEYIFTHEAGHFYGLNHSQVADSVMQPSYIAALDAPAVLGADDVAGICSIYPPGAAQGQVCDPAPVTGYDDDCGGDVHGACASSARVSRAWWTPLLLALILAAWVRRARRDRLHC